MSELLSGKLNIVRRKQVMVSVITGLSLAAGGAVLFLLMEMLADYLVEMPWSSQAGLPWLARAGALAVLLAGIAWILMTYVAGPIIFGPDDESIALAVERDVPEFSGRLIAAVQLSRPDAVPAGSSQALVRALVMQTESVASEHDFGKVVSTDRATQMTLITLLVLVIGSATFAFFRPNSQTLLARAFLGSQPVPRHTAVDCLTGDVRVARGDSLTIAAKADGVKPPSGTLTVAYDSGAEYQFPLDPDPDNAGQYSRKIENITESFHYIIHLNDGRSDKFLVEVADRPAVKSMDCVQVFPAYVHQPDAHHLPGDLTLLAGSRLIVNLAANKPLKQTADNQPPYNHIHLTGSDQDFPLDVSGDDATKASTHDYPEGRGIPIPPGTTGLSVYLVDENGFETKDPAVYRIDLIPDRPPTIRLTSATSQLELVTQMATERVAFDAADDYAIGRITLRYTVDGGDIQEIPILLAPDPHPRSISDHWDWKIAGITPASKPTLEGSTIEYWLHAEDQNTISNADHQPGAADTGHVQLRVVSEEEKRKELMNRAGAIHEELDPIKKDEQDLNNGLGQTIMGGTASQKKQ